MAANIFTGATNSNWGTATNWSLGAVPTASDGNPATFNAASPACTVDTSARVCNGLDFRGTGVTDYANTITMSQQITCSGSVTLSPTMTIADAGTLIVNTASTLTSATKTWPNSLTLNGAVTHTLADDWDVDGTLSLGTTSQTTTIAGAFTLTVAGGLTWPGSGSVVTGAASIVLNGTGTITGGASSATLKLNLTINTAGTITFAASSHSYSTGTLTYTAGTVVTTGSTLLILAANTTLAVNGITWNNVTLQGAFTHTLSENINVSGLLQLGAGTSATVINGSTINASAGVRLGGSSATVSGTTVINVNGTGTLDGPSLTTGVINNPITINVPGGTVTVATVGDTPFRMLLNQLNCVAGTIITDTATWTAFGGGGGSLVIAPQANVVFGG